MDEMRKTEEDKSEQMLLHMWGYQLPLMEKPISFYEFREKVLEKSNPKPEEKVGKSQESHADKIKRIREVLSKKAG